MRTKRYRHHSVRDVKLSLLLVHNCEKRKTLYKTFQNISKEYVSHQIETERINGDKPKHSKVTTVPKMSKAASKFGITTSHSRTIYYIMNLITSYNGHHHHTRLDISRFVQEIMSTDHDPRPPRQEYVISHQIGTERIRGKAAPDHFSFASQSSASE